MWLLHEEFVGKMLWELEPSRTLRIIKIAFTRTAKKQYIRYELPVKRKTQLISVEFVSNVYWLTTQKYQCNIATLPSVKGSRMPNYF